MQLKVVYYLLMRILIVDDEYYIRNYLTALFEMRGHRPIFASSVRDAKAILMRETFDIAIVDFSMPDGKGTKVVRFIKTQRPGTKVVGMSGTEQSDTFYAAGADFFIKKPFSAEQILEVIKD